MKGKRKHNKHRSRHIINFYSDKNGCHIWCESFLESTYALHLEFDESVACYASQPEFFSVHGRRYTPDFEVLYKSGYSEYVEVKNSLFMDDEFFEIHKLRKRFIYDLTKRELRVVSELDFNDIETENYKILKRYRTVNVSELVPKTHILPKKLPLSKLEKWVEKIDGATKAHAWALVANQYFHFNVFEPLGSESLLMRA